MAVKSKRVRQRSTGKVVTVYSSDGGKTWSKTNPTNKSKIKSYYTGSTKKETTTAKERLDAKQKALDDARKSTTTNTKTKTKTNGTKTKTPYVDPDAADKEAEKVFRSSSSGKKAKETHAKNEAAADKRKAAKQKADKKTVVKKKKITARSRMEARNREIHGDAKIDALKEKHRKWKEKRRSSKEERMKRRNERVNKKLLKINK